MRARSIAPNPRAKELSRDMVRMEDVMKTILEETIPDGDGVKVHESGRTICGPSQSLHGPLARFPSSVELAECPRGVRGGTWHTHVTKDELRNPHNSLPDTANVIFGNIDVSAVVGTQSVETAIAPDDREAGVREFQDALGADVQSTDDVVNSIISGKLSDPSDARDRVRDRMGSLFDRHRVNFTDLDAQVNTSGIPASSPTSIEFHEAQLYAHISESIRLANHSKNPREPQAFKNYVRSKNDSIKRATPANRLADTAMAAAVSAITRRAIAPMLP